MTSTKQVLQQKSLVLIFTYAAAGLGHLRVTKALYEGLTEEVQTHLLGSQDNMITFIHRIFSINPLLRRLFEWFQYNPQQYIFSGLYYAVTRADKKLMYEQLTTILDQRLETPSTILIMATHFALAHQVGVVKKRIEEERKVKIVLAVQVTDDSPQFMWYVPEADITFVPSLYTKKELQKYGEWVGLPPNNLMVNAYPVSPNLSKRLNAVEFHEKSHQLEPESKSQIHVSIPISGAAVGLDYAEGIIDVLYKKTHQFIFHIITRSAPYTLSFLNEMIQRPYVKLYVSAQDRDVVNAYEHVYNKYLISLEVTKPSEQAFKALLNPLQLGGSLLMFSEPVGRQEYDNINFMRRHSLIPTETQQEQMWRLAEENKPPTKQILDNASHWRGLMLPPDPEQAGRFIWWSLQGKLLHKMMSYRIRPDMPPEDKIELSPFGVAELWDKISDYLTQKDQMGTS